MANRRRYQAKKTTKGKSSEEVLRLLSWTIYFTSILDEEITFDEIFSLYRLRWRIEIIFKALKSHMALDKIHNVSAHQLKFILYGKLILLLLIVQFIYGTVCHKVFKINGKQLSILKLIRYLKDNMYLIPELLLRAKKQWRKLPPVIQIISKYCSYDKQNNRKNYDEQLMYCCLS